MRNKFFRFFSKSPLLKYPKLSVLGGGIAAATAAYATFKDVKLPYSDPKVLPQLKTAKVALPPPILDLDRQTLLNKGIKVKEIKVTSPLYPDAERIYQGFDVLEILKTMKVDPAKNDIIIFEAKDGFKSHIALSFVSKHHPILAFRQKDAPQGHDWEIVYHPLNGKTDGGPFYLMWPENRGKDFVDNHWAFGVIKVSFGSFQKIFGDIAPTHTKDPIVQEGFRLFADNCSSCHTLHHHGSANVAPDFKEIVKKYPSRGSIKAYAIAPPANSTMPKQKIPSDQLDAIEAYIFSETEHKLKP